MPDCSNLFFRRRYLEAVALGAVLVGASPSLDAIACECEGECAAERAEYHRCPTDGVVEGVACIYPRGPDPHARFLVLAEVERCPSLSTVFVRHVVKNLHPTDRLPFVWEGLGLSHSGLGPREDSPVPLEYPSYQGTLVPDMLRYGNSPLASAPRVSAPRYPLITLSAAPYGVGDVLVNIVETEYVDLDQQTRKVRIDVNSTFGEDSISYEIVRNDDDLTIAFGGIADQRLGQAIEEQLSAEVASLSELVSSEEIQKFPTTFQEGNFVVIRPYKQSGERVRVNALAKDVMMVPLAIMTEKFEPIAATKVSLFAP